MSQERVSSPGQPTGVPRDRALVHELSNLVDGSLRTLELARRELGAMDEPPPELGSAMRKIDAASSALGQIAGLVRAFAGGSGMGLSRLGGAAAKLTLVEAVEHGAGVMRARAAERGIEIVVRAADAPNGGPGTAVYPIIVNALRNSIEAISGAGQTAGRIEVALSAAGATGWKLEITDDGPGPAAGNQESRFFEPGFTTKPGSLGIGLALAADVVRGLGGVIALRARGSCRGAVLVVEVGGVRQGERSSA